MTAIADTFAQRVFRRSMRLTVHNNPMQNNAMLQPTLRLKVRPIRHAYENPSRLAWRDYRIYINDYSSTLRLVAQSKDGPYMLIDDVIYPREPVYGSFIYDRPEDILTKESIVDIQRHLASRLHATDFVSVRLSLKQAEDLCWAYCDHRPAQRSPHTRSALNIFRIAARYPRIQTTNDKHHISLEMPRAEAEAIGFNSNHARIYSALNRIELALDAHARHQRRKH